MTGDWSQSKAWAMSVDPDADSDQHPHSLPLFHQFLPTWTESQVLFVCVEVLQPSQSYGIMLSVVLWGVVSLSNHTFTGQA